MGFFFKKNKFEGMSLQDLYDEHNEVEAKMAETINPTKLIQFTRRYKEIRNEIYERNNPS